MKRKNQKVRIHLLYSSHCQIPSPSQMNCTYSLTLKKILQDILLIGGLNNSSCKGKRLSQCLTFLVGEIECEVAYIDLTTTY